MQKLFSIILMLALLLLAYVLDSWGFALRELGAQTFDITPGLWGGVLSDLVFMIGVLGFAWLVFQRLEQDKLVWAIYVLLGLVILFYLPLQTMWPGLKALGPIHSALIKAGPHSFFNLSGVAILVTGFVGLLVGREQSSQEDASNG